MSNPFTGKMKSTGASKMAHASGSAKNYESQEDKAERRYGAKASKFADGGRTPQPSDLYSPEDLKTVSKPQNMGASPPPPKAPK